MQTGLAQNVPSCICLACGQPIPEDRELTWNPKTGILVRGNRSVRLAKITSRIFDVMWKKRNTGAKADWRELMDAMYFDDPAGGPNDRSVVSTLVYQANFKLRPLGLQMRWGKLFDEQQRKLERKDERKTRTFPSGIARK